MHQSTRPGPRGSADDRTRRLLFHVQRRGFRAAIFLGRTVPSDIATVRVCCQPAGPQPQSVYAHTTPPPSRRVSIADVSTNRRRLIRCDGKESLHRPAAYPPTVRNPLSRRKPGPTYQPFVPLRSEPWLSPGKRSRLSAVTNRFVSC